MPTILALALLAADEAPAAAVVIPGVRVVAEDSLATGVDARLGATFGGALVGALPALGLLTWGASEREPGGLSPATVAGLVALPVGIALGAWSGHLLAGGKGTLGKAICAGLVSAALPTAFFVVAGDGASPRSPAHVRAETAALMFGLSSIPGLLFTTGLLEDSHRRTLEDLQVGVAPMQGGGLLSVGGKF